MSDLLRAWRNEKNPIVLSHGNRKRSPAKKAGRCGGYRKASGYNFYFGVFIFVTFAY